MMLWTEDSAKIRGWRCNTLILIPMNYNVLCNLGWWASEVEKGPKCLGNLIHIYTLIIKKYPAWCKMDNENKDREIWFEERGGLMG